MAAIMDDDEIRKQFQDLGEDVVVIDSTRNLLITRLKRLRSQRNVNNSGRRSLLNFSSDESESDSRATSTGTGSAILGSSAAAPFENVSRRTRRSTKLNNPVKTSEWSDDHFRQPRSLRRSLTSIDNSSHRLSGSTLRDGLSGGAMTPTRLHHQQRRSLAATSTVSSSSSSAKLFQPISGLRKSRRGNTDFDMSGSDSDVSDSSISNIPENTGVDEFPASRRSILSSGVAHRDSKERYVSKRNELDFNNVDSAPLINGNHGLLEEEPISNQDLSSSSSADSSFNSSVSESALKNHSQCISRILVIILAFFFIVIGLIYLRYRDQVPYNALDDDAENQFPSVLEIARKLNDHLRTRAGEAECGSLVSPKLGIDEAKTEIYKYAKGATVDLKQVLESFDANKFPGIKFYDADNREISTEYIVLISSMASSLPDLSWLCRVKKAWQNTVYKVSLALTVGLIVVAISAAFYWYKERRRQHQQEIYFLVEKILESLQNNYTAENTLEPYTPIPHVRDRLIPPAERAAKRGVWEAAVKFIQENESRVRQEVRMIKGEDISVWHWLPADRSSLVGRSRTGRLWQGQAFENVDTGVNALPYSPTQCLKVRNMFDPETEVEDDWAVHIKDEVLEKCAGLDIVHLNVDETLQGCVYVKCKDEATAGQVYKRLHGSWFDGKLVTVKYLRLERYLERFPLSANCVKALKPSTPTVAADNNSTN